jgi:glycosyltransferase involved in cell wall biosynthesis
LDQNAPLVTIGMPTYNGAPYLAASIDALLAQDYPSFQLVSSDNCSTDGPEAIARACVQRSGLVRYVRQATNLGASANFNYALSLAQGKYFMWAADHDLWEPALISRCVAALEAFPETVLAYPQSLLIDENGAVLEEMDDQIDLGQPTALARYKHLIWRLDICYMIYGVARREALVSTGGFPDGLSPDHVVLARLVLQGPVLRVGGHLYLRRQNRAPESDVERRTRTLAALHPPMARDHASIPESRLNRDLRDLHIRAVRESSLSFIQKLDGSVATLACFRDRFGVGSGLVKMLSEVARVTRLRGRLYRQFGVGA